MRANKQNAQIATCLLAAGLFLTAAIALLSARSALLGEAPASEPVSGGRFHPPAHLSETGLYDPAGSIDSRNLPFSPQYPLWSDGAQKSRWVRLPEGETIDVTKLDAWRFPTGTKFWKEFSWRGRKVETRMTWKVGDDDWVFAAYIWNEDQTDAVLAPASGTPNAAEISRGKRHTIPSIEDCVNCHRSGATVALGFNALQLSDDRDLLAPHAEPLPQGSVTLRTLIDRNQLKPPRPELVVKPPRIREGDPVARAALGYLSTNCGGCHNDTGPLARLNLTLLHDVVRDGESSNMAQEPGVETTLDRTSRYVIPGRSAEDSRIVVPGDPDRSVLLYRMRSRRPSSQMPPLGTTVPDEEAVKLLRRWIDSLNPRTVRD